MTGQRVGKIDQAQEPAAAAPAPSLWAPADGGVSAPDGAVRSGVSRRTVLRLGAVEDDAMMFG